MIDHAYNLLRLRPPSYDPGPFPAPRPPAGFSPPGLGAGLEAVRARLFGADPDAGYLEARMRQYMTLLHEGAFPGHVAAYDPRVTYLPLLRLPAPAAGAAATPTARDVPLRLTGRVAADDDRGISIFRWKVAVALGRRGDLAWPLVLPAPFVPEGTEPTARTLHAERVAPAGGAATTAAGDASLPLGLPGSGLVAAVDADAAGGDAWDVAATARPGRPLAEVLADVESLGDGPLRELFGTRDGEPFDTHRNLFRLHDQLPERLTGVLLALARRAHEAMGLPS